MTNTHRDFSKVGLKDDDDEEFMDVLEEKRRCSDLSFAFRTFSPQPYKFAPPCSTMELNRVVLESQFLRYVTKEVAMEMELSVEEVQEEAQGILGEMSQNLQLGFIRLMAYIFNKVFKRLYSNIFVNMEGLNRDIVSPEWRYFIRNSPLSCRPLVWKQCHKNTSNTIFIRLHQVTQEHPVILMPNHRSYVDFLVISFILFSYDIPIPVIAAGIPLAGMKIVGEILRRSGAFFIRRAIGSDKLYWAVLSEYVRTIVRKGFAPLEFFVEGFRSRTLKSLSPKLGMMHMVLEPFFKGEVFDITLLPISISYDRVLEESLLAHELLGIPKPKESTMGLLKASRVLSEKFGSMHVNFGHPLSVRQLCEGRINRCQYNLIPRDLPEKPTAEAQAGTSWLAHLVVRKQEEGSQTSPWSLMCGLLLQVPTQVLTEEGLPWHHLTGKTLWLRKLAQTFGARLNWPDGVPDSDVMSSSVALHRSIVQRKAGCIFLVQEDEPARTHPVRPEEGVMKTAAALLMLASYRNQCLHVFVRPALLATAIHITKSTQRDELLAFFSFLRDVFSYEFIFIPGESLQDFEEACSLLKNCEVVHINQQEVVVAQEGMEVLTFLQELLKPFIDSYQLVFRYLCETESVVHTEKEFLPGVRGLAAKLLLTAELHTYEALSSDLQKNVLSTLRRLEALTKLSLSVRNEFKVNKAAVKRTADMLCSWENPSTEFSGFTRRQTLV